MMMAMGVAACQPLPPLEYETEHLQLATDFSAPVCAGTLRQLESSTSRIVNALSSSPADDAFVVYWLEDDLLEFCDDDASGCYYPGTRVMFAKGQSIAHELVHAVIDSPGEVFFVEEGLAELMNGEGVRYDPARLTGELASQLRLSRRAYDHGQLDYPQAAHFLHWVQRSEGNDALRRLAATLSSGGGDDEISDQLEAIHGASLSAIEHRYAAEAPRTYAGAFDDRYETLELGSEPLWASVPLACDHEDVLGPLPGAVPGMYRVLRLKVTEARRARLSVDGDPGTRVELLDPYAAGRAPYPLWLPALEHEGRVARVERGEQVTVSVQPRTYLLVFIAQDVPRGQVDLQITR